MRCLTLICVPTTVPSLSASVTDNPPSAPLSASPPSEHQKVVSIDVEEVTTDRSGLSQEERDLWSKRDALNKDWDDYQDIHKAETEREDNLIKLLKETHELDIIKRKAEVFKCKKSLKELGMIWKRVEANLQRLNRKKELENRQLMIGIRLGKFQMAKILYQRDVSVCAEFEMFYGGKYDDGGSEECFEEAIRSKESKEKYQRSLLELLEDVGVLEEEQISLSEELNVVNKEIDDNIEGASNSANHYNFSQL